LVTAPPHDVSSSPQSMAACSSPSPPPLQNSQTSFVNANCLKRPLQCATTGPTALPCPTWETRFLLKWRKVPQESLEREVTLRARNLPPPETWDFVTIDWWHCGRRQRPIRGVGWSNPSMTPKTTHQMCDRETRDDGMSIWSVPRPIQESARRENDHSHFAEDGPQLRRMLLPDTAVRFRITIKPL